MCSDNHISLTQLTKVGAIFEFTRWDVSCMLQLYAKVHSLAFGRVLLHRGLQRQNTNTRTILQEMINGFLCPFIIFLKSTTHQLNFEGCD